MEQLVTVIIPVYNTRRFLAKCLDSVLDQSGINLEIILVDDGSTDGSGALCDEYAERDSRITVIHQENAGVSAARNAALERAKGDYILFVDSDDILPKDAIITLINKICSNGLIVGGMAEVTADGNSVTRILHIPDKEIASVEYLRALFYEDEMGYQGYLCNKLFDGAVLRQHRIQFCTDIHYNEDRLFLTEYLLYCDQVKLISDVVYHYCRHENSAQSKIHHQFKESMLTELEAFERIKKLLVGNTLLYNRVCRLCFEKSLYWQRRIPRNQKAARNYTRSIIRKNAKVCLKMPENGIVGQLKIIAHCILER